MKGMIICYGIMEMLLDHAVLLAESDYDKFLSISDKALRNAARNKIRLKIEQLMTYRKVTSEEVITLNDGRRFRYVRE